MTGRRELREKVFSALFESDFKRDETVDELYNSYISVNNIEPDTYFHDVFYGVFLSYNELNDLISDYLKGWRLERISLVAKTAIRISIYEISKLDIPFRVSVNEAVNLVKKFDDEKTARFVNGVLNSFAEDKGYKTETR